VNALEHEERPWGSYTVLADGPTHKVKRIVVGPGRRLSYQRYARRSEHWFVVEGQGVVILDGNRIPMAAGDSIDVPRGAAHRMENANTKDLVVIEVQHGDYFGEDDIVRLEDDFGRSQRRPVPRSPRT
jgi:mannose-6-phosphate isomerase